MAYALSEANAVDYLLGQGLISAVQAKSASAHELGGGVSNVVVRVDFADPSDSVVIKQSLPRLRVQQEWLADQARIHREAAALRYLEGVLPRPTLPAVVHDDPVQFLFVMTAAPEDARRGRTTSSLAASIRESQRRSGVCWARCTNNPPSPEAPYLLTSRNLLINVALFSYGLTLITGPLPRCIPTWPKPSKGKPRPC